MTTDHMNEIERMARAICAACEENPDSGGDARGNDFRWQDYIGPARKVLMDISRGGVLVRLHRIGSNADLHPRLLAEDALAGRSPRWDLVSVDEGPVGAELAEQGGAS